MKWNLLDFRFSKVSQLDVRHPTKQCFFVRSFHPKDSNCATILLFCKMITLGPGKKSQENSFEHNARAKKDRKMWAAKKESTQEKSANWQTKEYQNTKAYEIGPYFCHSFIVSYVSLRSRSIPFRHFFCNARTRWATERASSIYAIFSWQKPFGLRCLEVA